MGQARRELRALQELANRNWTAGEVTLPPDGPLVLAETIAMAQRILKQERGPLTAALQRFRATPEDMLQETNMTANLDRGLEYLETVAGVIRMAQDRLRIASARLELVERDR